LHPYRPDRRQHGEALPELAVETGAADLLEKDRVRLAQDLQPFLRHVADDPDREPWAGERVTPHHFLRKPQLRADPPHFVLEQHSERLHEIKLHHLG
jgi:hypothetical protein